MKKEKSNVKILILTAFATLASLTGMENRAAAESNPRPPRLHVVLHAPQADRALSQEQWVPQLQHWCDDVAEILNEGRMAAEGEIRQENFSGAVVVLNGALQNARDSIDFAGGAPHTITRNLIDRGLRVSSEIGRLLGTDDASQLTLAKFLFDYVSFTASAAVELDRDYYIPYFYRCGGRRDSCSDFDFGSFERKFVEFGRKQLEFVAEHLTIVRNGWTYPAGDPRAFFKAAQLFSSFVADDISVSLEAYARACSVSALRRFSARAGQVVNSNPNHPYPYPSLPVAVQSMATELLDLADSLDNESCFHK